MYGLDERYRIGVMKKLQFKIPMQAIQCNKTKSTCSILNQFKENTGWYLIINYTLRYTMLSARGYPDYGVQPG